MRPSGSLVQCHAGTEPPLGESPLYLRKTLEAVCPVELFKVAGVTFEGRQARSRSQGKLPPTLDPPQRTSPSPISLPPPSPHNHLPWSRQ